MSTAPSGPALEISNATTKLVLPAIPSFEIPTSTGGIHNPLELLIAGEQLRGTRIRVGSYITWIYDCAAVLARPGKTRAQIQKQIEDDPTQCERPKFYLGDARNTPPDRSIWIVDVPRPPFKLEQDRLSAKELERWPAVPRLAVGAYVEVTGTLALRSPHNETNSDGLIVYEAIDTAKTAPPPTTLTPPREVKLPALPKRIAPAVSAPPPGAGDSIRHANAGSRAYASWQYDAAVTEYEAAVQAWDGNHLAWYGLAGARMQRDDYRGAAEAAEHCVALVPDQAMYWLLLGHTLYEAALTEAQDRDARARGHRVDRRIVDRSALDVTAALQALLVAVQLELRLWRAHYLISRIHGDRGDAKPAAERLTEAIAQHAWEPGPYIALVELYRRWWYRDEALAIAVIGAAAVPKSAEVWYELGMAHDDRGERAEAIAAFTKALDVKPDLEVARFQRGQAYYRIKDVAHARSDLEAFVNAGMTSLELDQARRMLADLADRKR